MLSAAGRRTRVAVTAALFALAARRAVARAGGDSAVAAAVTGWLFCPAPLARVAVLRVVTWLLALGFLGFHLMTFSMITIIFLPHVVALLSLLPLERLVRQRSPVTA